MELDLPICVTCGVQYGGDRPDCPICLDERQWVGWDGQQWTSLAQLRAAGHRGRIRDEGPDVTGI
ncbi:MAG TPA: MBL fold metallo-hydrolase, partial [Streptosporangiaceae bacterium]